MEENAYIGGAIAGLAFLIAGVRLYRLSMRTGEAPERLMSVTFLVWSLSYLCWQIPIAVETGSLAAPLFFVGRITEDIGSVSFALFLQVVFRSQERWATWLVVGAVSCLVVGVGGSVWVGDWEAILPLSNPWWWFEIVAFVAVFAWAGVEGFLQHRKARQRLRLGLSDPSVCNQSLLWGLAGLTWVVYQGVSIAQQVEYEITQVWSGSMDAVMGALELSAIALIWLVFFPPSIYQRWIDRDSSATTVGEG